VGEVIQAHGSMIWQRQLAQTASPRSCQLEARCDICSRAGVVDAMLIMALWSKNVAQKQIELG